MNIHFNFLERLHQIIINEFLIFLQGADIQGAAFKGSIELNFRGNPDIEYCIKLDLKGGLLFQEASCWRSRSRGEQWRRGRICQVRLVGVLKSCTVGWFCTSCVLESSTVVHCARISFVWVSDERLCWVDTINSSARVGWDFLEEIDDRSVVDVLYI